MSQFLRLAQFHKVIHHVLKRAFFAEGGGAFLDVGIFEAEVAGGHGDGAHGGGAEGLGADDAESE